MDTGTGRIRGASVFGPPEAAAVIRPVLTQFDEWGVGGALPPSSRAVGGTDSTSFNNAGLPGIGMSQDPIEYNTMTHHTNLDTYERIVPDDVKKDAAIVAAQICTSPTATNAPAFPKDNAAPNRARIQPKVAASRPRTVRETPADTSRVGALGRRQASAWRGAWRDAEPGVPAVLTLLL